MKLQNFFIAMIISERLTVNGKLTSYNSPLRVSSYFATSGCNPFLENIR